MLGGRCKYGQVRFLQIGGEFEEEAAGIGPWQ
jgi:hypothetical protein